MARRRRRWSWSTSRAWPSTTSTTCPRRRSRSPRCPAFIELHERIAGLVAPSKVVAVALNTSLYPDEAEARRVIEAIAAETGPPDRRPGPLRCGPAVAGGPRAGRRAAVGPGVVSLRLTQEVLHLGLRDPFRIARSDHGARSRGHDRHRGAPRRALPGPGRGGGGLPGSVLRRDARHDGRGLPAAARGRRRDRADRRRPGCSDGRDGPGDPRTRGGQVRARHRAARPRRQGRRDRRSTSCSACPPTCRRPTSRSASTSPRSSPSAPPRAADFPGAQDQVRRSGRPCDARGGPRRLRRPDPGRCQHRLDARGRPRAPAATSSASASS